MSSHESFPQPHQEPFAEPFPSPEQDAPNQPFYDLLHNFAQEIRRDVEQSMRAMGMAAYSLDTQIKYEQHIDELLAERDRQRGRP